MHVGGIFRRSPGHIPICTARALHKVSVGLPGPSRGAVQRVYVAKRSERVPRHALPHAEAYSELIVRFTCSVAQILGYYFEREIPRAHETLALSYKTHHHRVCTRSCALIRPMQKFEETETAKANVYTATTPSSRSSL